MSLMTVRIRDCGSPGVERRVERNVKGRFDLGGIDPALPLYLVDAGRWRRRSVAVDLKVVRGIQERLHQRDTILEGGRMHADLMPARTPGLRGADAGIGAPVHVNRVVPSTGF